ncbi:aromatic ring-hydroxylating oxygenase subunit alpha [Bradyrhizobium cenepequi]|uniref:aromatic ring-hydroxylating oxygenase subunit alpha n=1 Tax=Bradyrhizobium cenepequi TaxID=2821403 RepID=UPI001CE38ACF|nr:aromatic ring-hydroxylating dioxygenase subunit alpha [Bradyrhizobium cenepequi]
MNIHHPRERLIDDRPSDKAFHVSRDAFTDPDVFELEMTRVFEATWSFVGLETQIPRPHDYITTFIGRQPVLLMRDGEGRIGCFLNTCRHRATMVCPFKRGRQKFHVCRYHGWAYDSAGRNTAVTDKADGQYPAGFDQADRNLLPVARLESYRGLIFASLSADVPSLYDYLDDARTFIDLVADQSPVGQLEFVPGDITYTFDANWKLQFENGLDYYHFNSTHSSYVDILAQRARSGDATGFTTELADEVEGQGSFNFRNGHAVNWSIKKQVRYGRALASDPAGLAEVRSRVGDIRLKWMLRQRNLTIFPNLQIIDISSAQLRTWRPLAVDKTEMTSHCLAPVGESAEARRFRIRAYEDFFNPSGLATSDDNVMYEFCQTGYAARAGHTLGHLRGLDRGQGTRGDHARELGIAPIDDAFGGSGFGGETNFHPGYREWRRLLEGGAMEAADA